MHDVAFASPPVGSPRLRQFAGFSSDLSARATQDLLPSSHEPVPARDAGTTSAADARPSRQSAETDPSSRERVRAQEQPLMAALSSLVPNRSAANPSSSYALHARGDLAPESGFALDASDSNTFDASILTSQAFLARAPGITGSFFESEGAFAFQAEVDTGGVATVNKDHPHLRALATGRLAGARTGLCVTATLENMARLGVPQPAASGADHGNNPRGAMVQLINDHGWRSLPGLGTPQTIRSPYGSVQANVIPAQEYEQMALAGKIPSGAIVFQTRHGSWNASSSRSRGFDMGIARDGGRTLFNYANMGGPMVYPDTRHVVVLVPGGAVR